MDLLEKLKSEIAEIIFPALKIKKQEILDLLETPNDSKFGDLSLPCFGLAKKLKKDPKSIASDSVKKIKAKGLIKEVKQVGPYINFYFDSGKIAQKILGEILKEGKRYGAAASKETVMMDVYQANPFKSFHIGHVRNAVFGEAVRRVLEFSGRKTVTATYNGDVGIHVARWLWYFQKFCKGKVPAKNFTKWSGKIYALASEKAKEKPEYADEINEINRMIDKRDPKIMPLWKKFRKLSYDDYEKIAKELDVKVEHNLPESICEGPGKKWVLDLHKKGKLKVSEGAIGIDLEKYGLGFFLLLKSDKTALYSTKDFGLLYHKNKLCKYDKSLLIVGSEQTHYFKQLFKAFEVLKLPGTGKQYHVSYNLVTLKEGKMASRLGNVISYEDLRDELIKLAAEETRKRNPKLSEKELKIVAHHIGFAGMKYDMLKMSPEKLIKFDWEEALSFEGNAAPYLLYVYARISSILRKAGASRTAVHDAGEACVGNKKSTLKQNINQYDANLLREEKEKILIKTLMQFPKVVKDAARDYKPHYVANYIFKLATEFNDFYESLRVLQAEPKLKQARLALIKAVQIVLRSALNLLGIEVLEKM